MFFCKHKNHAAFIFLITHESWCVTTFLLALKGISMEVPVAFYFPFTNYIFERRYYTILCSWSFGACT